MKQIALDVTTVRRCGDDVDDGSRRLIGPDYKRRKSWQSR